MTKLQKLCGGLLMAILYRGIFENGLLWHGTFDFLNWTLLISCIDEKKFMRKRKSLA